MLLHGATSGTDVIGFGILGHAQNLAENQVTEVGVDVQTFPRLRNAMAVNDEAFDFQLRAGYAAETSCRFMITISEITRRSS